MIAEFMVAYTTIRWARYTTCVVVLGGIPLCFWLTGGFPPHAWRFLAQTLLELPRLWALKGPSMLLPLAGLVAQAAILLCLWVLLVSTAMWIAVQQWNALRGQQRFKVSLHNAEKLAKSDEPYQEGWRQEDTRPMPPVAATSRAPTRDRSNHESVPQHETAEGRGAPLWAPWSADVLPMSPNPTGPLAKIPGTTGSLAMAPSPAFQPSYQSTYQQSSQPALQPSFQPTLLIGTGLNPGIKRKNKPNEDKLFAVQGTRANDGKNRPFGLFVIADGMGGHSNGQKASKLAVHQLRDVVVPALLNNTEISDEDARELLMDGIQHANLAIYQYNRQEREDMGTTITTALITDGVISVANVGDSRTYLYSGEQGMQQVTRDHSVVAQLVESGAITPEDVYTHPRRNEIYRSLGSNAAAQIDTFSLPLEDGTTLLLCSDGLWEMVRDAEIEQILSSTLPDVSLASEKLVEAALTGGGLDNISVIVVSWFE